MKSQKGHGHKTLIELFANQMINIVGVIATGTESFNFVRLILGFKGRICLAHAAFSAKLFTKRQVPPDKISLFKDPLVTKRSLLSKSC